MATAQGQFWASYSWFPGWAWAKLLLLVLPQAPWGGLALALGLRLRCPIGAGGLGTFPSMNGRGWGGARLWGRPGLQDLGPCVLELAWGFVGCGHC